MFQSPFHTSGCGSRRICVSLLLLAAALLFCARPAAGQLPNLRVGLPEDVDSNKRMDMQPGYGLRVRRGRAPRHPRGAAAGNVERTLDRS